MKRVDSANPLLRTPLDRPTHRMTAPVSTFSIEPKKRMTQKYFSDKQSELVRNLSLNRYDSNSKGFSQPTPGNLRPFDSKTRPNPSLLQIFNSDFQIQSNDPSLTTVHSNAIRYVPKGVHTTPSIKDCRDMLNSSKLMGGHTPGSKVRVGLARNFSRDIFNMKSRQRINLDPQIRIFDQTNSRTGSLNSSVNFSSPFPVHPAFHYQPSKLGINPKPPGHSAAAHDRDNTYELFGTKESLDTRPMNTGILRPQKENVGILKKKITTSNDFGFFHASQFPYNKSSVREASDY